MAQRRSELALPADFAKKIADTLNWQLSVVDEMLDFSEDKDGYFWATLKPKKVLDKPDFIAVCRLTRDLGGEDYLKGAKAWKVPGAYVKKGPTASEQKPSGQAIDSQPAYKEPGNALPTVTSGPIFAVLPIKALLSMPFQSRKDIEGPDFADLVESVKTTGILEPILVRPKTTEDFEIVAGERRVAAARKAGLTQVPAIVKLLSDQEAYEIQLVENVQRKDLSDMEKARMLDMMIKRFGYLQKDLARKLGKSEAWVSQHLAMLSPILHPGEVRTGELTEKQAREILAAPEEKREEILGKISETGIVPSSREIHDIVKSVSCARCGAVSSHPYSAPDKKLYCDEGCYKQAIAESEAEKNPANVGPFEEREIEAEEHVLPKPTEPEMHVHEGTSYDVADFTCPQCKQSFRIVHLPSGKHSFKPVREQA